AKLRAAGVDPDPARLSGLAPSIGAREPAFPSIWAATGDRTPIRFTYKGQPRQVEPWAMTYRRGAWYLLGRDRDRDAPRMFKVARVDAPAQAIGKAGSYQVPDVDLDAAWRRLEPRQADTEAIVAIRPGRAVELVRRGRRVEHAGTVPSGYEVYAVGYARAADLVGELCAHGADALVLSPLRIRQSVITELKAVAGSLS
ncbi:MAG TPA: WYL domain-containing protein, partial [Propionicimonas sp.]|nr:WYL domain-containing protein [Propionicimonas sp.]